MSKFDYQQHLREEYGDDFDVTAGGTTAETQDVVSDVDSEGNVAISFGTETFYVQLPEKYAGDLPLLSTGAQTPEESYRLSQLLRMLKTRGEVGGGDRQEFIAAVQKRERELASRLRQQLKA